MNHQTPDHQPDDWGINNTNPPSEGDSLTLRIVTGFGLGLAALAVLALAGGSLNVTTTGVTMKVNPRQ